MRIRLRHILLAAVLITISGPALHAQKYPERKSIRSGNREYEQGNYPQSEVDYRRALERNPASYEAQFNLGNALYRQERFDESAQIFQQLAQDTTHADHIAECHYNAGNALFQQRKLQEALEAYKNSLRKNPADMDAKFNLAYVKKMLEDEQGDGGGGGNDDQNQDQQGDQNQDQNQGNDKNDQQDKGDQDKQDGKDDKGDKGDDKQDKQDKGDQNQDKGKNEDKPQQGQQPQQQGMTETEAQQMLDAVQAQEDRTQDKVDDKKKAAAVRGSRRNW